jgi:hypothetical protein
MPNLHDSSYGAYAYGKSKSCIMRCTHMRSWN